MLLGGRKPTSSSSPTLRESVVKCPNPLQPAAVPCRASIPPERGRESSTKWPQAFGLTRTTPRCAPLQGRSIPSSACPECRVPCGSKFQPTEPLVPSAWLRFHQSPVAAFGYTSPRHSLQKKKKNQKALLLYLHCTQVSTVQKICRCKYVLPSLTSPPFLIYVISIFLPCTVN